MTKIVVIQHVPYEILGTMNPRLKEHGIRIKYVNFSRGSSLPSNISDYDGLIILGGPMNVDDVGEYPHLDDEIKLINQAREENIPILGICLGAQLIAKAFGAKVTKGEGREIGWYNVYTTDYGKNDPILKHFAKDEKIFQWHSDSFALPDNATLLATSSTCCNQAFKINHNIYGFQFHLEVDKPLIERWLEVPLHKAELEELHGKFTNEAILADTVQYIERTKVLSHAVFDSFIELIIGHNKAVTRLYSR